MKEEGGCGHAVFRQLRTCAEVEASPRAFISIGQDTDAVDASQVEGLKSLGPSCFAFVPSPACSSPFSSFVDHKAQDLC